MNEETAKIIARVKKMLALADPNSGATEGERDNALRMAHATLAKYNLSLAQVEQASGKTEEARTGSPMDSRDFPWMRTVAFGIAHLMFCEYFFIRKRGGKVSHFFVGREGNVQSAQALTGFILSSIDREGLRMEKARTGESKGSTYWRSFCKGAAARVYERCDAIRTDAEAASAREAKQLTHTPGTALVLASVYEKERQANLVYIEQTMKVTNLRPDRARQRNTDWSAADDGRKYGDKVNLTPIPGSNDTTRRIK